MTEIERSLSFQDKIKQEMTKFSFGPEDDITGTEDIEYLESTFKLLGIPIPKS